MTFSIIIMSHELNFSLLPFDDARCCSFEIRFLLEKRFHLSRIPGRSQRYVAVQGAEVRQSLV